METDEEKEEVCELCGGSGEVKIGAHQEAGVVVDEVIMVCLCKLPVKDEPNE